MKKFLTIIIVISFFPFCNKDFLNRQPLETASLETLFSTGDDLVLAVNGIYDVFQGSIWGGSFSHLLPHYDALSEDAILAYDFEGGHFQWAQGTITAASGGIVDYKWNFGYRGISRANAVLANINRPELDIADNARKRYEGETRFLRGLMYFELATYYGGVPLILEPVDRQNAKVPRNTKEEVISAVLADLDFAIANLETSPSNDQVGRPTKQSALGIKTKVLLFNNRWEEAAAVAKQVIDLEASGVVSLSDNYEALFDGTDKANKEVLFDVQFAAPAVGEGNYLSDHYGPVGVENGGGWGSISYQEPMFDAFYMKDGLPKTSSPLYDPANPYANRDPRLYWSFFVPGFSTWQGQPYTEANYGGQIPDLPLNTKKWVTTKDNSFAQDGNANLIILRYADVLLMYAEAQNEAVGPDESVYQAINKVRIRAQMPEITPGLSKDQLREVIRHERKVEFSQEGLRFFDLVRWGIAEQLINSNTRQQRNWKADTHTVLPIPQSDLDANPNLVQNPNY